MGFDEWNELKKKLSNKSHKPPFVKVGDIWWCSLGKNVGREIMGSSKSFSRPVVIVKKLSSDFFFVVPATTRKKEGEWFVPYLHCRYIRYACIAQARSIDYRRLTSKIGELEGQEVNKIQSSLINLLYFSPESRRLDSGSRG